MFIKLFIFTYRYNVQVTTILHTSVCGVLACCFLLGTADTILIMNAWRGALILCQLASWEMLKTVSLSDKILKVMSPKFFNWG